MANNLKAASLPLEARPEKMPTPLQKHCSFWDRDNDGIIKLSDVYQGFRELGFSIPFSMLSFLIPVFFSYPTKLAHSYFPDPRFRIYLDGIHKAKHGSDTGIFDLDGNIRETEFDNIFARFDEDGSGGLNRTALLNMVARDRLAADPAGWTFSYMEWSTTWLLMQRDGRIWKDDLKQCYDGSLFWRIREENMKEKQAWKQGYGLKDFWLEMDGFVPRWVVVATMVALVGICTLLSYSWIVRT
ncbi:calcium binding protein [Phlyctema vagabunda]|uniref:Calcium binding protein n=1 Tax=Phlyctema vagabunda TaxID=108571 RepID=A0ABR4PP00_9HELO